MPLLPDQIKSRWEAQYEAHQPGQDPILR